MVGQRENCPAPCRKRGPRCRKNALSPSPRPSAYWDRMRPRSHAKPVESSQDSRLDAFFTAAPAGLAILDRELRYVQLNETLAEMNGCSVAEHLGRSVRQVLPALAASVEPILQRILTTGEPALNIDVSGETPAQPGVTRYWVASYFPLPGPGGTVEGIGGVVVEDTAPRRARQAPRPSGAGDHARLEEAASRVLPAPPRRPVLH